MAQGLRRRPARIRRLGIGLVMLGAAVGCASTDKAPSASLPSSLPPPSGLKGASATTPTPKATTPSTSNVAPIDNRQSNSMLPASDASAALRDIPTNPSRGQASPIGAPAMPYPNGSLRSPQTTAPASPSGGTWNASGNPVIAPASTVPDLPAPGGLKNTSPTTDVPQPPAPPVMSVTPPTPAPGAAPTLPTGALPK